LIGAFVRRCRRLAVADISTPLIAMSFGSRASPAWSVHDQRGSITAVSCTAVFTFLTGAARSSSSRQPPALNALAARRKPSMSRA